MKGRWGLLFIPLWWTANAQVPNIRVSDPASRFPEEVTIAVSPANPQVLGAGANIDYYYYSHDGGEHWTQGQLTSPYGVWGDPSVTFDSKGNLYYGHLSRPPRTTGYFLDRIVVHKSTDGGVTWDSGAGIGYNPPKQQDKEWLGVDLSNSPYHDNLYVAWTQFDSYGSTNPADSSRILFSRSTNGGQSWSEPVRVSDRAGDCLDSDSTDEGAVPAVGPNGEVYLSWSGPLGILFDRSTDGGVTFGKDVIVTSQPGGWDFNVPGISRCNGMPVTACDISNSPHRGAVYIAWSDQRNGLDNTDVFLVRSPDGGVTWSDPIRVNDDMTISHQFFPWMAVDQSTGNLYFVFYDRRETTGDSTEVFCARSSDGGATFTNFRVSDSVFVPVASVFFGDYINIAASGGAAYPIWMRMDAGALSVWTAKVSDATGIALRGPARTPGEVALLQNYPNPFNPGTTIEVRLGSQAFVSLKVYDVLGREVAVLLDAEMQSGTYRIPFRAPNLPSGVYYYRMHAGSHTEQRSMVLLK